MLTMPAGKFTYMVETIGDRIRAAREQEGLSQQDLADAAGVSKSAVSQWETGDTKSLRPDNLFKIARRLDRRAEWIITGRLPQTP